MTLPRAHDLIWIADRESLKNDHGLPDWVGNWRPHLPLVVRRDRRDEGSIPVGVRGMTKIQRAAAWVKPDAVLRVVTPESLVADPVTLLHSRFISLQPMQALITLASLKLPWHWGVTGSCAYALVSDIPVMHAESDLDLVIRCDHRVDSTEFSAFHTILDELPCRVDVQINTPQGGFALTEWLRGGETMLKTDSGPVMVTDPWSQPDV
ncbi:malonate decarboxylase holo-ACP synthase [Hafnia psychrotolerans]|uniref:malonate decarboxylase holo-ACP synthase n=1 Tax=Hafnia psychrotolerans TaxID=1477018 RepID=UPI00166D3695|nr:malonate decarboxylase holo-ACP synthase [Hafnia psychrotolerans]